MSIILKGIDMPKDTKSLMIVWYDQDDYDTVSNEIKADKVIQIPTPHGRLIDADEFKSWVDDWYDCTDIGNIVESWIDERPTILEAEE